MAAPIQHTRGYELEHLLLSPSPLPTTPHQNVEDASARHMYAVEDTVPPNVSEFSLGSSTFSPFFLRTTTLIGFTSLYLLFLLVIVVLAIVDTKMDGISAAKNSQHYLWTFGPTAVLVVVAALWNQVEYRTKQMMPWKVLQQRPTYASKTLLLDYITPMLPSALLQSIRTSHWPVTIAIIGSLLIKLLTVASTGLLVLQKTPIIQHDCRLTATNEFVASFNTSKIGSPLILATLAIQNGTVPFPPGTSRNMVFQHLQMATPLTRVADIEVEGLSSIFRAGFDCEVATLKNVASGCSDIQCHALNITLQIDTPTCHIKGYNLTTGCGLLPNLVSCDVSDAWGLACDSSPDDHDKNRVAFMIGSMEQILGVADPSASIHTDNTTAILCEPHYNITNAIVRMDERGNLRSHSHQSSSDIPSQLFHAWDLVDGMQTATQATGLVLHNVYAYKSWSSKPWIPFWYFFEDWVKAAYPSSNLKDEAVLISRANEIFSMAAAQMARQNLMRASSIDTPGTCYRTEDRLRIRGLSLYLMGISLGLLMLSTIGLIYVAPRNCTSRDPASIGGLALVLSQSPSLLDRLSKHGSTSLESIEKSLCNSKCQSSIAKKAENFEFSVNLTSNSNAQVTDFTLQGPGSPASKFWRPFSLLPTFKIFVVVFLLIIVVVLEVLYSVSGKNDGITAIDPQSFDRFAWAYVPAIVMLTAQAMVGSTAFSSFFMFPYLSLRKGLSNTRTSLLRNYLSLTAIECLWASITKKHPSVVCMAVAMLLTPLLTIVVSGLYTSQAFSIEVPITLSVIKQFNSSFTGADLGFGDAFVPASANIGLILTQNFTYPLWTYNEFAFPEARLDLSMVHRQGFSSLDHSNVTASLPGIRSDLKCNVVSQPPRNFSEVLSFRSNVTIPGFAEAGCKSLVWTSPGQRPFGFFSHGTYSPDTASLTRGDQTYCGAYGMSETNWKAFTCSSVINELDVEITINASTLVIIAAKPNEMSSRMFSNRTLSPKVPFPSGMIPALFGSANFLGATAGYYDPGFQAVIYESGTRGDIDDFPMAEFMNDTGFDRIAAHMQHVHRTVIAQSASQILMPYDPESPLAPPQSINATLRIPDLYRLQQSGVSTRILDGLLIAIALCIALSFGTMDTSKVLYKNPASIAAAASLVAGESQMLSKEVLPVDAQWYSDTELKAKKVWDGLFFKLKWWDGNSQAEQRERRGYFKLDAL